MFLIISYHLTPQIQDPSLALDFFVRFYKVELQCSLNSSTSFEKSSPKKYHLHKYTSLLSLYIDTWNQSLNGSQPNVSMTSFLCLKSVAWWMQGRWPGRLQTGQVTVAEETQHASSQWLVSRHLGHHPPGWTSSLHCQFSWPAWWHLQQYLKDWCYGHYFQINNYYTLFWQN